MLGLRPLAQPVFSLSKRKYVSRSNCCKKRHKCSLSSMSSNRICFHKWPWRWSGDKSHWFTRFFGLFGRSLILPEGRFLGDDGTKLLVRKASKEHKQFRSRKRTKSTPHCSTVLTSHTHTHTPKCGQHRNDRTNTLRKPRCHCLQWCILDAVLLFVQHDELCDFACLPCLLHFVSYFWMFYSILIIFRRWKKSAKVFLTVANFRCWLNRKQLSPQIFTSPDRAMHSGFFNYLCITLPAQSIHFNPCLVSCALERCRCLTKSFCC